MRAYAEKVERFDVLLPTYYPIRGPRLNGSGLHAAAVTAVQPVANNPHGGSWPTGEDVGRFRPNGDGTDSSRRRGSAIRRGLTAGGSGRLTPVCG